MNSFLQSVLIFLSLVALAWFGKSILLPIIFAFFLWVVILSWQQFFGKVSIAGRQIPQKLRTLVAVITFFVLVYGIGTIMSNELQRFSEVYPTLENNIQTHNQNITALTGVNIQTLITDNFDKITSINFAAIAQKSAATFSSIFGTLSTIIIFLLFIFTEQKFFTSKLKATAGKQYAKQQAMLEDILISTQQYLTIKIWLGFLIALVSYLGMVFIGLEFPFIWAFLIFIFSFIPNIGPLLASLAPTIFALVNFTSWWQALVIFALINAIQLFTSNILEPKYLSERMNVSPLLVIVSLFFWEALWGLPGVFVAVPLTAVSMIILLRIPATHNIGVWMSEK